MEGSRELSSFPRLRREAEIGQSARSSRTRGSPRLPLAAARDDVVVSCIMLRPSSASAPPSPATFVCCARYRLSLQPFAYFPSFYRLYETVVAFSLPIVVRSVTMRPIKLETLHAFGARKRSMKLVRMAKLAARPRAHDRTNGSYGAASASSTRDSGCVDASSNVIPVPPAREFVVTSAPGVSC